MNDRLIEQLIAWYGHPGSSLESKNYRQVMMIGNEAENILLAAEMVANGESVTLMSTPQISHQIVPHPASRQVGHKEFCQLVSELLTEKRLAEVSQFTEDEIWNDRGLMLYELGWKHESLECFLRSLALNEHLPYPWVNLGRYFMDPQIRNTDLPLAQICLNQALAIKPDDDMALANLAGIFARQGDFQKVRQYATQAVEANEENFFAHYYLAASLAQQIETKTDRSKTVKEILTHANRAKELVAQCSDPKAELVVERLINWAQDQG